MTAKPFRERSVLSVLVIAALSLAGCAKKSGYAMVLEKEHIEAASPPPTPSPGGTGATPAATRSPADGEPSERVLAPGEIVVDTIVMNKNDRGTSHDPRALRDEQWLIKVEMVDDLRRITVPTDRRHFDKTKIGDRIKVRYRQGNYSGTVWSAGLED